MTDDLSQKYPVLQERHDGAPTQPLRDLAADAISTWRGGAPADAYRLLAERPDLLSDRSCVFDLVLEEYCLRRSRGEELGPTTFRERFESFGLDLADSIERLVTAQDLVDQYGVSRPAVDWPGAGDVLVDDFEVLEEIGRGGLARAYLCEQLSVGRRLTVVKLSRLPTREAEWLGKCEHPNIAPVYGAWTLAGGCGSAICMPYQGKLTLRDLIRTTFARGIAFDGVALREVLVEHDDPRKPLIKPGKNPGAYSYDEPALRQWLLGGIATGLDCAHQAGVVHGDVKPSNVLIGENGAVLIDFNLSRSCTIEERAIGGTLPYLPPELREVGGARGGREVTVSGPAGDIFSFGVTAAELICGSDPPLADDAGEFSDRTTAEALAVQTAFVLGACERLAAGDPLREILPACLQEDPAARPTAETIAASLASGPAARLQAGAASSTLTRRRAIAGAAAVGALVVIGQSRANDLYADGARALAAGDNEVAIASLTRQLGRDPDHFAARYALAWALIRTKRFEPAFSELKQLKAVRLDDYVRATYGYCCAASHRYQSAIPWYESVGTVLAGSPSVMNNLGCSLWMGRGKRTRREHIGLARALLRQSHVAGRATAAALLNSVVLETGLIAGEFDLHDRDYAVSVGRDLLALATSDAERLAVVRLYGRMGGATHTRAARATLERLLSRASAPSLSAWRSDPAYATLRSDAELDERVRAAATRVATPRLRLLEHPVEHPRASEADQAA